MSPPPPALKVAALVARRAFLGVEVLAVSYGEDPAAFEAEPARVSEARGRDARFLLGIGEPEEPERWGLFLRACPECLRRPLLVAAAHRLVRWSDGAVVGHEKKDPRFVAMARAWGDAVGDPVARLTKAVRDVGVRAKVGREAAEGVTATLLDRIHRVHGDDPEQLRAMVEEARDSSRTGADLQRQVLGAPEAGPPPPPGLARRLEAAVVRSRDEGRRLSALARDLDEVGAVAAARQVRHAVRRTSEARTRLEGARGGDPPRSTPIARDPGSPSHRWNGRAMCAAVPALVLALAVLLAGCGPRGAAEVCNEVDDDGDGLIDEGVAGTWYLDADGDGYGDPSAAIDACEAPEGAVEEGTDCDDADPATHPGAEESCTEAVDRDCDGSAGDEDADGDGIVACEDCDDTDPAVHPGAEEVCNGLDDDCDGERDEDGDPVSWYLDEDGDGYGLEVVSCAPPEGMLASEGGDCDDAEPSVHPGAEDVCDDGIDQDCDGYRAWCELEGELDLGGTQIMVVGEEEGDRFGYVYTVGDVDGDGIDDLVAGATKSDRGGEDCGAVYFVHGPITEMVYAEDAEMIWPGDCREGAFFPYALSLVDIDRDGSTDVVASQQERVLIFSGPHADATVPSDATLMVEAYSTPGEWDAGGDLDGDGTADIVVSDFYTSTSLERIERLDVVSGADAGHISVDDAFAWMRFYWSDCKLSDGLNAHGDLDGDGYDDLVVGRTCGSELGHILVFSGPLSGDFDHDSAIGGIYDAWWHYQTLDVVPDQSGDGLPEILTGTLFTEDPSTAVQVGATYVLHSPHQGTRDAEDAEVAIFGSSNYSCTGAYGAMADVDGDGFPDLVAKHEKSGLACYGAEVDAFGLFFGSNLTWGDTFDAASAVLVEGTYATSGTVPGGDLTGDGIDDLIVGSWGRSARATTDGAVYVVSRHGEE